MITEQRQDVTPQGVDKTKRYGWDTRNGPGEVRMVHKDDLYVNRDLYQRVANSPKVLAIARSWSWVACGTISVAMRDGVLWVIDGGHRKAAADRRSDITMLPCVIHQVRSVQEEARGFLDTNTLRRNVSAIDKFRAKIVAGDENAIFANSVIEGCGLRLATAVAEARDFKSVALAEKLAASDPVGFQNAMLLCGELAEADKRPVHERLLGGLHYLHNNVDADGGLENARLRKRLKQLGIANLIDAANRAAAYYAKGGNRVWADGMLQAVNKGLRDRFEFSAKGTSA